MITVTGLEKSFSTGSIVTPVLRGIDLAVPSGQFLAIVGPSGSGKSTFLYQLGLLDRPTKGSLKVEGKETTMLSEDETTILRRNLFGFVFQDYALLPELTALENVLLPALTTPASMGSIRRHALEALTKVDLDKHTHKRPSQLSGGQQQRVSIARAIARKPKIIFADEPTANLDSAHARDVVGTFSALHKQGQTIIMVTHEAEFAAMAERIVELRDGKIVSDRFTKHGK